MIDTIYTQDCGNQIAVGNINIGGKINITNVPATHLLFLEKQLDGGC